MRVDAPAAKMIKPIPDIVGYIEKLSHTINYYYAPDINKITTRYCGGEKCW